MSAEDVRQPRSPLRRLGWVVLVAALLSLLLLPLPSASKVWILVVVAFAGVFTLLEARAQGKALAAIMAALLALYLGLSLQRAWILLSSDVLVSKLFAVGMIVLPVLGVWALVREVVFGSRLEGLGRRLEAEGGLPEDLPRRPSGRIVREAADADFERWAQEAEAAPGDWRSWYRLGLAYSASGDTARARRCMRDAVALSRGRAPRGPASTGD
ncbi:tetratricopeptide repeat protein [Kocuria palustris]|uniref:tetratricopeptide repeat protein n=1 Tax=Kocuria palustris TaxID=71999 RepID=UPI0035E34191